jgi:hypothetical protein
MTGPRAGHLSPHLLSEMAGHDGVGAVDLNTDSLGIGGYNCPRRWFRPKIQTLDRAEIPPGGQRDQTRETTGLTAR